MSESKNENYEFQPILDAVKRHAENPDSLVGYHFYIPLPEALWLEERARRRRISTGELIGDLIRNAFSGDIRRD